MHEDPGLIAKTLVDQHYAAGPDRMKEVLAETIAGLMKKAPDKSPREALLDEVRNAEQASLRGSE